MPLPWPKLFPAPLPVAPGSHSASKPHFEAIPAMLDPTRAVSTSTRHNPFKFDDRSMSNAPYNAIAHAHRFEAPTFTNWVDPGHPLTQRSLPACKRTYFACSWMLTGSRGKGSRHRSYPRPNAPDACVPIGPHRSVTSTSLAPQANDLVFEDHSRTCSAQMRIRISSRVRLGTRAALPDSEYLQSVNQRHSESNGRECADRNPIRPPFSIAACANSTLASGIWPPCALVPFRNARRSLTPCRNVGYDIHRDYAPSPPPAPAFHSCTTPNVIRRTTPTPSTPGSRTPRYDTQQALPFLDPRAALVDPAGAAMIFSEVTTLSVLSARQSWDVRHHRRAQCPMRPFPHRIHCFPRLPPQPPLPSAPTTCVRSARGRCSSSPAPRYDD
ncbi:hypothetical protein B0H13DRAFT_2563147 [Mycena leptocephala]|nr:hypothetical protein B0H13DRAFT_2563147 [Mycena leptocephala]